MEKSEPQQYRDDLAKEIKEAPKQRRGEVLEKAKETSEYRQARSIKIHERQAEEEIDEGLGVLVKNRTIYHGSATGGIRNFNKAEEDTVGSGIYFTSEAKNAIGYARRRSRGREGASPVIYESSIENMRLLDLRKDENVKKVLNGFKQVLQNELKKKDLKWSFEAVLQRSIELVNTGKVGVGNLREITFSTGQLFTDYVRSLGYEGLIALEGGEGGDISDHDTYLIFDPERVRIDKEDKVV